MLRVRGEWSLARETGAVCDTGHATGALVLQQSDAAWRGGQATSSYEQNTQQSPALGWSNAPQPTHSWNHAQAFVGMVCVLRAPQCGQARVDKVITEVM
jgi:hypothetical protein